IDAERRHVHEARAVQRRRLGDRLGALALHGLEALAALLAQDADQVDDRVGVAHRGRDRARMAHVRLHGMDLPDPAERLEMVRELWPAHRDADAVVALGERPHDMAADEPGAAEDGDQRVEIGLDGHAALNIARDSCRGRGLASGYRIARGVYRALMSQALSP